MLTIPSEVGKISSEEVSLPTYSQDSKDALRTLLRILPSYHTSIMSYFSVSKKDKQEGPEAEKRQKFSKHQHVLHLALRLHNYTQIPPKNMKRICERAGVMTQVLSKALDKLMTVATHARRTFDQLMTTQNALQIYLAMLQ